MPLEIIKFEKSPEVRLKEFRDILRCEERSLSIEDEWKHYIESVLEPSGWQAVWQVSRSKCEEFKLPFTTVIFVEVLDVNFHSFFTKIQVIGVQDDINIPEVFDVPLQELYPTLQQENNQLNVEGTANCLEQYRFFFEHIWFPWDNEKLDTNGWADENLSSRIDLYRDMYSGGVIRETSLHIRSLIQEARKIHKEMDGLKCEIEDCELDQGTSEWKSSAHWIELHLRMQQIKIEVETLENPTLRPVVIQLNEKNENVRHRNDGLKEICLIWLGGTIDELVHNLTNAKNIVGASAHVRCFTEIQVALDQAIAGDTMILCAGIHQVNNMSGLKAGGSIMGMLPRDVTVLQEKGRVRTLLEISAVDQDVTLENLTISANTVQALLLVRCGTVHLNNCNLIGDAENKTLQGIQVLSGSKLLMKDCNFSNIGIAIVVNKGAEVSLDKCTATGCYTGLKILGEAKVTLQQTSFTGCKEYGIIVERSQPNSQTTSTKVGPIAILDSQDILFRESFVEGLKAAAMVVVRHRDTFTLEEWDDN